jgi:asparagine synthase (glutamine-hydrolysing)
MSAIFGYVDWEATRAGADVLSRMGDGGRATEPESFASVTAPGAAFGAQRTTVPAGVASAGPAIAAVVGAMSFGATPGAPGPADAAAAQRVLAEYRDHGVECLARIHGPFALALADSSTRTALLAVDRLGIRTLSFASPGGRLVFGSTAGHVVTHPDLRPRLSEQGLFNYLYAHVVPSPGTVYRGVEKLLPAERLALQHGRAQRSFYWRARYADASRASEAELEERFRTVVRDAVARCAGADEAAAFLSGGTDSSTVAGLLTQLRGKPARTYSIGFEADGFDEIEYARIAARHFGTDAREYYVTPQDVLEAIPVVARQYDEPFGNASAVPTYLCARLARGDGYRVMLAGDGGDELFGGNVRYAKQKVFEYYGLVPGPLRRALIEPLAFGVPGGARLAPVRKARSYIAQAKVPLPDRLETYNFLHRAALDEIFEPDFLRAIDAAEPLRLLREVYERTDSASPINRMLHLDLKQTLADNDLRKVSGMCEAAGVEARYPFLDEAVVALAAEIPPKLKVKGVKLRYLFKQALRNFLPPEILRKTKHGFGLPFGVWLREYPPLADLAADSLAAFGRRGIVRQAYIDRLVAEHRSGHATYYGTMIWVLMIAERWLAERRL